MLGLTSIVFVDEMRGPASVNRHTGVCYVNKKIWDKADKETRLFILLHENAHITLQTTNEFEADKKAFEDYSSLGYSLKKAVKSLTSLLKDENKEHRERALALLLHASRYDQENNNSQTALNTLNFMQNILLNKQSFADRLHEGSEFHQFLGIAFTDSARKRKDAKQAAKNQARLMIAEGKAKGFSNGSLKTFGQSLGDTIGGIGKAAGGALGINLGRSDNGGSPTPNGINNNNGSTEEEKDNTMLYVGGGLLLVGVLYFMTRKSS